MRAKKEPAKPAVKPTKKRKTTRKNKPQMSLKNFFENLKALFTEEESESVDIKASVYRNEDGEIEEVRVFNQEYDEFMVIEKGGKVSAINVKEYMEK